MTLTVKVISPDHTILDTVAEEVILPSSTGQLGILTGHAPLISALETGVLRFRKDKAWAAVALTGGFAEVEENEVTVLVRNGELGSEINAEEARQELAKAEQDLANIKPDDKQGKIQAEQHLRTARARVQATTPI
ncbi:MAG: ATP synthase F1 subunit epsilon [Pseudanabaena sp.]|jgi:F-type H+-transporting ATPase subunit epsilon|uniref:ATP synthase epsilon chain n=1 Tax=Pseudanabaena yagii GIHE-NHR1 TaxID=2722753 RepID=A0ABX1LPI6_9CYAN|nr:MULTISPECIES: ATP synthase F1 subunit epsilon [Pseudanabaena]MCA6572435.1 F0F1 ATP synthase subunit epsilon [Pseudanabaena sp. M53BS1SP1A06MG]MCA6583017.1 F0F1 ATP synthase subunit epsilon [Pseudanabaena sp. M34BS1SP1A06MG]MCA6587205.1 F0F1 ATP synthase subunit epsilon [Pseudanabaena sp. M051S1SP1A06QC]MCA6588597.1 F0F1 ATP synthase subunit epsilon [Pseudanabaena sp. M109S1SP1A06QC]MCA6591698.1 F0F1 ATP synthase subunit epsilon [Pseudanabaena sp. M38BS1SP1A06MG]MCA6595166.1 F0F1 ATP syntha